VVTERARPSIGRLMTTGTATSYPLPTPTSGLARITVGPPASAQPVGITAGPDGALCFTEAATRIAGRMATDLQ
jgi:virginiamycin B lyase